MIRQLCWLCRTRRRPLIALFGTLLLIMYASESLHVSWWWTSEVKRPFTFNWTDFWMMDDDQAAGDHQLPDCSSSNPAAIVDRTSAPYFSFPEQPSANLTAEIAREARAGRWRPSDCVRNTSIVLIVPFRQRHRHLHQFLPYMHSFLREQLSDYAIVVVEQPEGGVFNKGRIMNAAFMELRKSGVRPRFDCYIFHDVDLLPLDKRLRYECSDQGPTHMATAIDKFRFKLPYMDNFGGVVAFTGDQFQGVNGFSNRYYGWGAEDDDIYQRVILSGQKVQRPPLEIARYRSFRHAKDPGNPKNPKKDELNRETERVWRQDGLSSLNYSILAIIDHRLYLNITIDAGPIQPLRR